MSSSRVLCAHCCQCLWIVNSRLPLWFVFMSSSRVLYAHCCQCLWIVNSLLPLWFVFMSSSRVLYVHCCQCLWIVNTIFSSHFHSAETPVFLFINHVILRKLQASLLPVWVATPDVNVIYTTSFTVKMERPIKLSKEWCCVPQCKSDGRKRWK
jgi:ribosomal protein L39E